MAEHLLDRAQVRPLAEQVRRKAVAQRVRLAATGVPDL